MKTYPKVPRHDHPSVDESFYNRKVHVLEKVDGQNFRIIVYDSSFSSFYSDEVKKYNPEHGDVILATKTSIRGKLSDDLSNFDGSMNRVIRNLREKINVDKILNYHEKYNSPLVLFGEHMIPHTIDYGYEENPPPSFIGFDIYKERIPYDVPNNPFDERFDGFLPIDETIEIFENAGLETVHIIERDANIDINSFTVPESAYRSSQAEGVVFRSDENNRRVKYVIDKFKEKQKVAWGDREENADSGEEIIVARYITNARIRKHMHKLNSEDEKTLAQIIVRDVWNEEFEEIKQIDVETKPSNVYELCKKRCEEVVENFRKNAKLNQTTIEEIWKNEINNAERNVDLEVTDISIEEISNFENKVSEYEETERGLVEELIEKEDINSFAEELAEEKGKNVGRWVIGDTINEFENRFWVENRHFISDISLTFVPSLINRKIADYVRETINERDDVACPHE